MKTFRWSTEYEHANNDITMSDYIENHLPDSFEVILSDGSYAEIRNSKGKVFGVQASGDGDFKNHKVEFRQLNK